MIALQSRLKKIKIMIDLSQEEKQITIEEALKMPELAHLHEAMNYALNTPFKKMFPNKYKASIKHSVEVKTRAIFQKQATMPLKKVVSVVLEDLDDDTISAELILEMTQLITQNWQRMTATAYENEPAEMMV